MSAWQHQSQLISSRLKLELSQFVVLAALCWAVCLNIQQFIRMKQFDWFFSLHYVKVIYRGRGWYVIYKNVSTEVRGSLTKIVVFHSCFQDFDLTFDEYLTHVLSNYIWKVGHKIFLPCFDTFYEKCRENITELRTDWCEENFDVELARNVDQYERKTVYTVI